MVHTKEAVSDTLKGKLGMKSSNQVKQLILAKWEKYLNHEIENINIYTGGEYLSGTKEDSRNYIKARVSFVSFMDWLKDN